MSVRKHRSIWYVFYLLIVGGLLVFYTATPTQAAINASPIMTGYDQFPNGYGNYDDAYSQFEVGVYDGTSIWMVPSMQRNDKPLQIRSLVKLNPSTGAMTAGYDQWPAGFDGNYADGRNELWWPFSDAIYVAGYIWMTPMNANMVVRMDPASGVMTGYDQWPAGFWHRIQTDGTTSNSNVFSSAAYANGAIWMIPYNGHVVVSMDVNTGVMTEHPLPTSPFNDFCMSCFSDVVNDGTYLWLIPQQANAVVRIDPSDGSMVAYNQWPASVVYQADQSSFCSFSAGAWDGASLWMYSGENDDCGSGNLVFKLTPSTGVFTAYSTTISSPDIFWGDSNFTDMVWDGSSIWMVPDLVSVVRIDPSDGSMTEYNCWPTGFDLGGKSFNSGVSDGSSVWLIPLYSNQVVRIGSGPGGTPSTCSSTPTPTPTPTPPPSGPPSATPVQPTPVVLPAISEPTAALVTGPPIPDYAQPLVNVNPAYASWSALGITPQEVLTDTLSISLTQEFLSGTPQWPLANLRPIGNLATLAIRDKNNTERPMYKYLRPQKFPETGYSIYGYRLDYWQRQGGVAQQGYPIADPMLMVDMDTGQEVIIQYTERGRIEQPIIYDGSLGLPRLGRVGAEYLAQQLPSFPRAVLPVAVPADPSITYFAQTRHTIQGVFATYFTEHDGLNRCGYPLSEPFMEQYTDYPYPVTVQYFERSRMEYHGDPADPLYGQITFGRIGAAVYEGYQQ